MLNISPYLSSMKDFAHSKVSNTATLCCHKGLVSTYGEGGPTKWENCGSETFYAPSQNSVKISAPPSFKGWKLLHLPFSMAKTPPPPPFGRGKPSLAPPPLHRSYFVAAPPLPIISDQYVHSLVVILQQ